MWKIQHWWEKKSFSEQEVWLFSTGLSLLLYAIVGGVADWIAPAFVGFAGGVVLIIAFIRLIARAES